MALVAIVVAWNTRAKSEPAIAAASSAARSPLRKPRAGSSGVVGVFRLQRWPLASSARVTSVKVPPTSRAIAYSVIQACPRPVLRRVLSYTDRGAPPWWRLGVAVRGAARSRVGYDGARGAMGLRWRGSAAPSETEGGQAMRWATYRRPDEPADRVGLVVGEQVYGLPSVSSLLDLLGDDGERLARAGEQARAEPAEVVALADVRLRPPIPRPPSVRDFYAFEQHVREARIRTGRDMDPDWYALPVFYFTNPHAIVGPGDPVPVPPGCGQLDFELEVAAIVGRDGANLKPADAERYVAGYTILNDWSARDL